MLLSIPIVVSLLRHDLGLTLGLFAVAAISDAADGFLAKRCGWQSAVGAVLDPTADKLLLVTVFVTLAYLKLVPSWLMQAAVARDALIVAGAVAFRFLAGPIAAHPSIISKLNTLCQALFILAVVGNATFLAAPQPLIVVLGALVLVTVILSGIDYVLVYSRLARRSRGAPSRATMGGEGS